MRMTMYAQPIQKSGSKAFIEKKLSVARMPGATSTASAARPCAKRRPPIRAAEAGQQGRLVHGAVTVVRGVDHQRLSFGLQSAAVQPEIRGALARPQRRGPIG